MKLKPGFYLFYVIFNRSFFFFFYQLPSPPLFLLNQCLFVHSAAAPPVAPPQPEYDQWDGGYGSAMPSSYDRRTSRSAGAMNRGPPSGPPPPLPSSGRATSRSPPPLLASHPSSSLGGGSSAGTSHRASYWASNMRTSHGDLIFPYPATSPLESQNLNHI